MISSFYNHEGHFFLLNQFEYCIIYRPRTTKSGNAGVVAWYHNGSWFRADGPRATWGNRVFSY